MVLVLRAIFCFRILANNCVLLYHGNLAWDYLLIAGAQNEADGDKFIYSIAIMNAKVNTNPSGSVFPPAAKIYGATFSEV